MSWCVDLLLPDLVVVVPAAADPNGSCAHGGLIHHASVNLSGHVRGIRKAPDGRLGGLRAGGGTMLDLKARAVLALIAATLPLLAHKPALAATFTTTARGDGCEAADSGRLGAPRGYRVDSAGFRSRPAYPGLGAALWQCSYARRDARTTGGSRTAGLRSRSAGLRSRLVHGADRAALRGFGRILGVSGRVDFR